MSRLFALGLLLLGSARAVTGCSDIGDGTETDNAAMRKGCAEYSTEEANGWTNFWGNWCGTYDDADFTANDMCCACGGGVPTCVDTNNGATDTFGDSCVSWYDANPSSCGNHDDTDFTSNEMCCACGGGDTLAPVPAPTPVPCQDSTTWRMPMPNNENKGCEWVGKAKTEKRCTKRGADGEKAKRACPATCGGCPGDDDGAMVA